jgi:hypothetical protein
MTMLPFGTYKNSDGTESLGLALPAMIHEPLMAVERLFGTPSKPGTFAYGPDYPGNANDMRTLLFSTYGGNALSPARAAEALAPQLLSDTGKPSLFGSTVAGAEGNAPIRAYHGTATPAPIDRFNPDAKRMAGGEGERAVWFSPSSDTASRFADVAAAHFDNNLGAVYPADIDVSGFKHIAPEAGYDWRSHMSDERGPYQTYNGEFFSNQIRQARDEGHPGVIFQRVWEGPSPEDQIAVLQPGRVKSATTGETLFSDQLPSLFGAAVAPYNQDNPQGYASGGNVADTSGLSGLTRLPDYGFGPVTPTSMAGYPNGFISSREPDPTWGDTALSTAEFPARALVNQFDAAGTGIADAMNDPSLPNLTNAGVQTGLALMSPEITAASGLGGMGLAALRDADIIPSAEARTRRRAAPVRAPLPAPTPTPAPVDPVLDKIKDDPSLLALYQQIKVEQNNATRDYPGRNGDASRAEAAARVQDLQKQFSGALAARDAVKQHIYDQQVQNALAARDVELGRDRTFSDTEVGKVYDKLGGYAPLVAGFVPGVVSRLAYGPATEIGSKLLRAATGAGFGVGANNVPLVYNSFSTEVDNPEQKAYAAYAYNLPDDHPDKAKAQAMANDLPKLNPLREEAQAELYDPYKFGERAFMGALEGFGGNELGQMTPGAIGGFGRRSSLQLPERAILTNNAKIGLGGISPEARAQQEAAAKLLADKQAAAPLSSGPDDLASGSNLPALGDVSDIPPAAPVKKAQAAGRRSKPAGSKGPSKAATVASDNPPAAPDKEAAASEELKRFFGAKQAPDLRDLKATGGPVDGRGEGGKTFSGPLHSDVAGRTDHIPTTVRAGSFVVPADVVSALGESNTTAGTKVLDHMFPKLPESLHYSSGGAVPIMAAGGEYVIPPEAVAKIGGGDLEHGHNILDKFVLSTRNDTIKTLKSLPGPQR